MLLSVKIPHSVVGSGLLEDDNHIKPEQAASMINQYLQEAENTRFGITNQEITAAIWFDVTKLKAIIDDGYDGIRFYFAIAPENGPTPCPGDRRLTLIAIGTKNRKDVGFDPDSLQPTLQMENCECGTGTRVPCPNCPRTATQSNFTAPNDYENSLFLRYAEGEKLKAQPTQITYRNPKASETNSE